MEPKEDLFRQGLSQGRTMRFRPMGSSMLPFLKRGDIVTIAPATKLRVGDVVLWQRGEAAVMHRVVAKRNGRIITKGDSLGSLDAPVTREQILGTAVLRERWGRTRRLDHFGFRFLGMAWCLTSCIPGLVSFLAATRRALRNQAGAPTSEQRPPVSR